MPLTILVVLLHGPLTVAGRIYLVDPVADALWRAPAETTFLVDDPLPPDVAGPPPPRRTVGRVSARQVDDAEIAAMGATMIRCFSSGTSLDLA